MKTDLNLSQLAQAWLDAKEEENAAIAKRRGIGALIEKALPGNGEAEGSTSAVIDNALRVYVTRKVTRKVNVDALTKDWEFLPANARNAFKWSAEVAIKHLRALEQLNAPELELVREFITTKPAASSVEVERISEEVTA